MVTSQVTTGCWSRGSGKNGVMERQHGRKRTTRPLQLVSTWMLVTLQAPSGLTWYFPHLQINTPGKKDTATQATVLPGKTAVWTVLKLAELACWHFHNLSCQTHAAALIAPSWLIAGPVRSVVTGTDGVETSTVLRATEGGVGSPRDRLGWIAANEAWLCINQSLQLLTFATNFAMASSSASFFWLFTMALTHQSNNFFSFFPLFFGEQLNSYCCWCYISLFGATVTVGQYGWSTYDIFDCISG